MGIETGKIRPTSKEKIRSSLEIKERRSREGEKRRKGGRGYSNKTCADGKDIRKKLGA